MLERKRHTLFHRKVLTPWPRLKREQTLSNVWYIVISTRGIQQSFQTGHFVSIETRSFKKKKKIQSLVLLKNIFPQVTYWILLNEFLISSKKVERWLREWTLTNISEFCQRLEAARKSSFRTWPLSNSSTSTEDQWNASNVNDENHTVSICKKKKK